MIGSLLMLENFLYEPFLFDLDLLEDADLILDFLINFLLKGFYGCILFVNDDRHLSVLGEELGILLD
jgi:hypothetical protein